MRHGVAFSLAKLCLVLSVVLRAAPAASKPGDSVTDGAWAQGAECSTCNINTKLVDVNSVFDSTWHDSTHHPGDPDRVITITFNGTAVYVFHLIANAISGTTTFTNLTFHIDGEQVGSFTHTPDDTHDPTLYRVPVYQNESLSNTVHTLETRASGPTDSLVLFDFIAYTTDDGTSPSSTSDRPSSSILPSTQVSSVQSTSSAPVGAIVGGIVGGVCVLAALVVIFLCDRKRRRARRPTSIAGRIEPFTIDDGNRQPGERAGRRWSRVPTLPPLRMGRRRLMPGTGSSTTGDTATSIVFPQPPPPAQRSRAPTSATATSGSATRSNLERRIKALETQVRNLESGQESSSSGTGTTSDKSSRNTTRSRGRSRSRSRTTGHSSSLRSELVALRGEITELRGELEQEQRLLAEVVPPPPVYSN
ncbi:hypothetical protein C8Q74DRAFT_1397077 [Fomes fomentarius]|nr:hypothetical protein C8Q74DRAFT_1397077 [Fomes fomentarius]